MKLKVCSTYLVIKVKPPGAWQLTTPTKFTVAKYT